MTAERLSKFLARTGAASRRRSEEIIRSGRVKVNRAIVADPAHPVDPDRDAVYLDGKVMKPRSRHYYIALHKPPGYLSDLADVEGKDRPLARRLIHIDGQLFPVGRLDYASEGLMIFTNDGDFANLVMHPRFEVEKEYHIKVSGSLSPEELKRATSGLNLEGARYRLRAIFPLRAAEKNTWYRATVAEGKYRHIRRLVEALSHRVLKLRRVRIGPVGLGSLKPGQWRPLDAEEIKGLTGPQGKRRQVRPPDAQDNIVHRR